MEPGADRHHDRHHDGHHEPDGEFLDIPERVVIAPSGGVYEPPDLAGDDGIAPGQPLGAIEVPGSHPTQVRSPFPGRLGGLLAHPGERVREGQPVAWLRPPHDPEP